MSLATALLTPILGDASPWTPRRLFQLGEAGGVYDPSDLTAEKVAWRRNLLTWSEDFTNAAWTKTRSSITPNAGTSWDGTATASKLVEDTTASNTHLLSVTFGSFVGGLSYTTTIYAKAAERSVIVVRGSTSRYFPEVTFDLSAGTATVASGSGSIEPAGSGWYRCRVTATATSDGSSAIQVNLAQAGGSIIYTGDGTSGALIDSAQLEVGSTATAYQRITDFTSDFLAAFPTHGLYQDAAGTTPVTALGQPVGLVIDSKTGGISTTSLIGNGAIGIVGTATAATYNTTTGAGTCDRVDASNQSFVQWSGLNNASSYRVTLTNTGAVTLSLRAGGQTGSVLGTISVGATTQLVGLPSTGLLTITAAGAGGAFTVLAFNEVPGVHAIQATSASRPLLDARVNLLTFSEQFDNAAWTKADTTVTANATTAPNGTTTADSLLETATTAAHAIYQAASVTSGASYQWTGYVRANGRTRIRLVCAATSAVLTADYNISAITATVAAGSGTVSIESIGSGWFRLFATATATGTGTGYWQANLLDDNGNLSYLGDVTKGMFIWGADHRLAADAAYPYQRVAAATDYADVGVPRAFAFDGFDDSLYTASNMDLSGTDKVTVLAGVRKLSDAATGMLAELGPNATVTNGTFGLIAPSATGANSYRFISRGATTQVSAGTGVFAAAPDTSVLTGIGNIAAPLCELRRNAASVQATTASQGGGNYTSNVLHIGRSNNASIPFNGKAYQLIVRGALTDAATLAQAERYVGARTGVFL